MRRTTKEHLDDERLDQLGRALINASAMTDDEVEAAASPFLHSRVWARIVAERERRARSATWLDLLIVGRRAVPAMLAVAVALGGWFWIGSARSSRPGRDAQDSHLERIVLTGATILSDDDVLTFLTDWPVAAAKGQEDAR